MGYTYTSLEPGGQVIKTKEPRPDLDELARWVRSDAPDEPENPGPAMSSTEPVAGPVNTNPVTGGEPPLLSTSAGIANPADTLTAEQAQEAAAKALADGAPAPEGDGATSDTSGEDTGSGESTDPERPALNGTTEEWLAFAKHPSIALDVPDDAGREAIVAAYIAKFAPAGNASGKEWADYAGKHGVAVVDSDGRDKIRAAVIDAGWAASA